MISSTINAKLSGADWEDHSQRLGHCVEVFVELPVEVAGTSQDSA